jgi:hypothetical protein
MWIRERHGPREFLSTFCAILVCSYPVDWKIYRQTRIHSSQCVRRTLQQLDSASKYLGFSDRAADSLLMRTCVCHSCREVGCSGQPTPGMPSQPVGLHAIADSPSRWQWSSQVRVRSAAGDFVFHRSIGRNHRSATAVTDEPAELAIGLLAQLDVLECGTSAIECCCSFIKAAFCSRVRYEPATRRSPRCISTTTDRFCHWLS